MTYYVNEDRPTNSTRVHRADCYYYVHRVSKIPKDGRWHGPFETLETALEGARQTGRKHVSRCKICLGQEAANEGV